MPTWRIGDQCFVEVDAQYWTPGIIVGFTREGETACVKLLKPITWYEKGETILLSTRLLRRDVP